MKQLFSIGIVLTFTINLYSTPVRHSCAWNFQGDLAAVGDS